MDEEFFSNDITCVLSYILNHPRRKGFTHLSQTEEQQSMEDCEQISGTILTLPMPVSRGLSAKELIHKNHFTDGPKRRTWATLNSSENKEKEMLRWKGKGKL